MAMVAYRATDIATVMAVGLTHPTVGRSGGSVAAPAACGFVSRAYTPVCGLLNQKPHD